MFNRCSCLPVVCVYGPLNAVLFNEASFPDPDGQFPDPTANFPTKMAFFFKTASSQKRSRRNSGQNRPIERSTALTGTIFVAISVFMSWGPKVDPVFMFTIKHRVNTDFV